MKKFLLAMVMVASTLAMTAQDADAKRLGGGSSSGRQSTNVARQATPAAPAQPNQAQRPAAAPAQGAAPAAVPPKPASPWKGIAAGLIGGALLGAALSHFGLGGAMASALGSILTFALMGLAIFFIIRMIRGMRNGGNQAQPAFAGMNNAQPAYQPQAFQQQQPEPAAYQANNFSGGSTPAADPNQGTWSVPADFDVNGFLRNAKGYFIRLQAAWDKADLNDLREFTSPEMFAELRLQIQERGNAANVTDVVSIDAQLLGIEDNGRDYLASVRFTGMIKEDAGAPAEPFNEVWNLAKPANGSGGWVLAGIQQG